MSYTFDATKQGYANLWDKAKVNPEHNAQAMQIAKKIIDNEAILRQVQDSTDVPWWLIGCWLYRESDLNFGTYLGNGQSLQRVTTEVPRGRGPFATFLLGAIDAIRYEHQQQGGHFYKVGLETWVLEYCLWASETWNGWGYTSHNVNSPYMWDWTDLYTTGLFDSDGHFDPSLKENRAGVVAIMMALFDIDPTLMPSRIAKEKPMTTTTTPAPVTPDEFANIVNITEKAISFLPTVSMFVPQVKVLTPFVPLITGGLEMLKELEITPHDPQAIIAVLVKHLGNIQADLATLKQPAGQPQNTGT